MADDGQGMEEMTMKWFGESWGAPVCEGCPQTSTPVGEVCNWCKEPIIDGETGVIYSNGPAAHLNCFLRGIFGSVAHIEGRCSCVVPHGCANDPEGMTKRQGADAAVAAYYRLHGKRVQ